MQKISIYTIGNLRQDLTLFDDFFAWVNLANSRLVFFLVACQVIYFLIQVFTSQMIFIFELQCLFPSLAKFFVAKSTKTQDSFLSDDRVFQVRSSLRKKKSLFEHHSNFPAHFDSLAAVQTS